MPISIHLPADLLRDVDRRARHQGVSRSSYIAQALRREAEPDGGWSPGFFDELRAVDDALERDVDSLVKAIGHRRSRKAAPRL